MFVVVKYVIIVGVGVVWFYGWTGLIGIVCESWRNLGCMPTGCWRGLVGGDKRSWPNRLVPSCLCRCMVLYILNSLILSLCIFLIKQEIRAAPDNTSDESKPPPALPPPPLPPTNDPWDIDGQNDYYAQVPSSQFQQQNQYQQVSIITSYYYFK